MALKQWHEDRQMKCWQTAWRWVKIVTVTRPLQIQWWRPTATWPPPQYAKLPVLNFGLGIYLPPLRVPHYSEILLFVRVYSWDFFCTPIKLLESPHFRVTVHTVAWCFSQCQFFNSKWNCNIFLMLVFYFVFSQEKVKQDKSTKEDREAIE